MKFFISCPILLIKFINNERFDIFLTRHENFKIRPELVALNNDQ